MNQHFLSASSLNRDQVERLLASAERFARGQAIRSRALNHIIGLWFLDSSTRTRVGFEVAAMKLGAKPFHISQKKFTERMSSEESFEDTLRVLSDYSDLLCIRGDSNFVEKLSNISCPIINCGNGDDEHPTQALTDIFTISEKFGQIDNLRICIAGDLLHMRTGHSLTSILSNFNNLQISLVSPLTLQMPQKYIQGHKNNQITQSDNFVKAISEADVIYMTGFAPKTPVGNFSDEERFNYQLNEKTLKKINPKAIILCPLPRIDEILTCVDAIPQAKYFEQSRLGLFMRMAIINQYIR